MNLSLKLVIVSGFVTALTFQGGRGAPPPAAASGPVAPASATRLREASAPSEALQNLAASAFALEVIRLSAKADGVDRLWQVYKKRCGVRVGRRYDFGREWFSIWDRAGEAAIDAPGCADVPWRLRHAGESVLGDLRKARVAAREAALGPGTEVGMLRWHALQWPQAEVGRTPALLTLTTPQASTSP
jgi:hypothetical protein